MKFREEPRWTGGWVRVESAQKAEDVVGFTVADLWTWLNENPPDLPKFLAAVVRSMKGRIQFSMITSNATGTQFTQEQLEAHGFTTNLFVVRAAEGCTCPWQVGKYVTSKMPESFLNRVEVVYISVNIQKANQTFYQGKLAIGDNQCSSVLNCSVFPRMIQETGSATDSYQSTISIASWSRP